MEKRPRYSFKKELKYEFLRGMKLKYIAENVGISYSYMSSIIQGRNVVDDYLMEKIMLCIGYTISELKNTKKTYFILDKKRIGEEG